MSILHSASSICAINDLGMLLIGYMWMPDCPRLRQWVIIENIEELGFAVAVPI